MSEKSFEKFSLPSEADKPSEDSESGSHDLLNKLNKILAEDIGSKMKWKKPLESLDSYGKLRGESVVMVDDSEMVLGSYAPHLMAATEGEAVFIRYRDEELEPLVDNVLQHEPTVVVLDYSLPPEAARDNWDDDIPDKLNGAQITKALRDKNFTGKIIGFSSEKTAVKKFMLAGADATVEKSNFDFGDDVAKIAEATKREKE